MPAFSLIDHSTYTLPVFRFAIVSSTSVEGVPGYPETRLTPAASAPSAIASFPIKNSLCILSFLFSFPYLKGFLHNHIPIYHIDVRNTIQSSIVQRKGDVPGTSSVSKTSPFPLSRSHILCIDLSCRESPSLPEGHTIRFHRYNLLYTKIYSFGILFEYIFISVYLLTRAPAPPMMPSTSSTVAMDVSPGVVIASAP